MLAVAEIVRPPRRGPRLVAMASRRREVYVDSYDGACLLLGILLRSDAELKEAVLERFGGRPTVGAFAFVAGILQQAHREHRSERAAKATRRRALAAAGRKVCSRCGEEKDLEAFNRDRSRSDGRRPECRECQGRVDRANYAARRGKEGGDRG